MIKQFLALAAVCLLVGCGMDGSAGGAGERGPAGPQGEKGEKGDPGEGGEDAGVIVKTIFCKYDWPFSDDRGQELKYTVLFFSNDTIAASLNRRYYARDYEYEQTTTAIWPTDEPEAEDAYVADAVSSAKLLSDKEALFTRKAPDEEKEVDCVAK